MVTPHILSIVAIVLLFFLIFGIIGISYFKGKYFFCANIPFDSIYINTKWDCLNAGANWQNEVYNFDNIFYAIATLF